MAIVHRNGLSANFEKSKMTPCEIDIVRDTQEVFVSFDAGNVKQMATKEDFQADIKEIQELKERAITAAESAESLVVNKAGINDLAPTLTEAYSGAKTEQIVADTRAYADGLFGSVVEFNLEVVAELPTENIHTHTIYLVAKEPKPSEAYDEYLYINSAWEHIGTTDIDLSGYYRKEEINASFVAKNQLMVNVKDYGALGDGVANDTVAIQNAINSLTLGGIVYFPPGRYLSKKISLGKNVGVRGSGIDATTVKLLDNENTSLFEVSEKNYVTICNMTIDGNGKNQTDGAPISFNKSRYNTIDKIKIINAHTSALNMSNVENSIVKNSVFIGTIKGAVISFSYSNEDFSSGNNSIIDCDVSNGKGGGISCRTNNSVISRNRVYNNGDGIESTGGIQAIDTNNLIISDNIAYHNNANGIMIMSCTNCSIDDNISYNNVFSGIRLALGSGNITLSGNRCYDDQVSKTQEWGIKAGDDCESVVVTGNICTDNIKTEGISLLSTYSVQSGNLPSRNENATFSLKTNEYRVLLSDISKMAIIEFYELTNKEYARILVKGIRQEIVKLEDTNSIYRFEDEGTYYSLFYLNGAYVLRNRRGFTVNFQVKISFLEQN